MSAIIQALIVSMMIGMSAYIFDKTTDHTSRLVQQHRNEVQKQFADEREQMKSFVMTTVEREVSTAVHTQTK